MRNAVRGYDWGSRTALAALQGRAPSGEHEAELWMGAHPLAPSLLVVGGEAGGHGHEVSLAEMITADPSGVLGEATFTRFGPRLPFLLKVLAVERALSVQVHPGQGRAAARFAEEEALGLPVGSDKRTYVDPYAKPEFLYALTEFDALAGLRTADDAAGLLGLLDLPDLDGALSALSAGTGREAVRTALARLLHMPDGERRRFADDAARRAEELLAAGGRHLAEGERAALRVLVRLRGEHPGDVLVVAPLLLRLHRLPPGGTIFLPTGVPHAYLGGLAVEIMATSDNVLRAGLTTKHVDAEELLAALDPDADAQVHRPESGEGVQTWPVPVPEFRLARLEVTGSVCVPTAPSGPSVVLCTGGRVEVHCLGDAVALGGGESAFVPDGSGDLVLQGAGEVFVATPGS